MAKRVGVARCMVRIRVSSAERGSSWKALRQEVFIIKTTYPITSILGLVRPATRIIWRSMVCRTMDVCAV